MNYLFVLGLIPIVIVLMMGAELIIKHHAHILLAICESVEHAAARAFAIVGLR